MPPTIPILPASGEGTFSVTSNPQGAEIFFTVKGSATFTPGGVIVIQPEPRAPLGEAPIGETKVPVGAQIVVAAEWKGIKLFQDITIRASPNRKVHFDFEAVMPEPVLTPVTNPSLPARTGKHSLTSITLRNEEKKPIGVLIMNSAGLSVVKEKIPAESEMRLAGNIGRHFFYSIERTNHAYFGNLSSDDVCLGKGTLPIRVPGHASKLDVFISDYSVLGEEGTPDT